MIEVNELSKSFKKTIKQSGLKGAVKSLFNPEYETFEAVKNLTFDVKKGEILGFIGANGAGKSTTIKMLTGILTPTSGTCRINGKIPQENRTEYVKEIGVVFGQRTQLWWDLALQETYSVLKEIYEVPDKQFQKRMDFLNEVLELHEFIKDPVRTLSLGQRMRADIAASLLHSPKVLFLDEPTIGLDVAVKDNIRKAIMQINQEEKTTIILTTHDLADIELLCNRIYMIDKGEAMFDGSVSQLKSTFGKIHEVDFELFSEEEVKKINFASFSDVEIEQVGRQVKVRFDATKITVPQLLHSVMSQAQVLDVSVKDADIEEIIRRFFRKEI
ncbi:ABC transporter ATP-binding protein [Lactococcus protaetiae]|uniref:ATP-binding cassette domain-containing protein n=1 Tax=Lactococcus protaetiae TaxID=2592653 RepID=A0A514ZBJ9_9LACT|nr:ATP-binding cassette domain-containing protein [Lactococcus protaetiae]MCL2113465.1 ATP-binding cassette domain-containing protein [Streptococcaceae bacterium]QDK71961.1 ATP-binding cassette domain-containing protein [Lactococcus protaetiae]